MGSVAAAKMVKHDVEKFAESKVLLWAAEGVVRYPGRGSPAPGIQSSPDIGCQDGSAGVGA